ncbi:MAG TPA: phosphoribosylformylglycinamidine synthase subunit PurS [Bacteroidales bacterium]|nr:phosphoribosylformylglycinamidine synthase subunit PurS [Bacteroidales bacterium]
MKKFIAQIDVMPLKALLDPQGKAVNNSLLKSGYSSVENVRVGKHICFELSSENKVSAEKMVDEVCRTLLANPIMEGYHFVVDVID